MEQLYTIGYLLSIAVLLGLATKARAYSVKRQVVRF